MQTPISRFLRIETARIYPDRRACGLCGGRFFVLGSVSLSSGPITVPSSTVVAHHERGELDGAQEVDGG